MFIRIKKIKGIPYGYKIRNVWTKKGPRQKKTKYLGRVIIPEKKEKSIEVAEKDNYRDFVKELVKRELELYGFKNFRLKCVSVDLSKNEVRNKGRRCVIKMNEGYLCDETLRKLLNYNPSEGKHEEEIGYELAELFVNAGIKTEHEIFVKVFETLGVRG